MANLSAALNSLASTTVVDFFRTRGARAMTGSLRLARLATVAWGAVLLAIGHRRRAIRSRCWRPV